MEAETCTGPRIVLAGSVSTSRRTLQGLIRNRAHVVGTLGLAPEKGRNVSGYARLDDLAQAAGIPYKEFRNINDQETLEMVQGWRPDLFFVVGLSQLVRSELLAIPRLGCVGFHPTWLPEGRGRAPVAWIVLDGRPGAATFFLMDEGADSGPILAQEPFYIAEHDYAADVLAKLEMVIDLALDRWLPALIDGEWHPKPQDESLASYNGRRSPADGLIDWNESAESIYSLIRAASQPHPGAYTFAKDSKLIIWRAEPELRLPYRGVIGRIVDADPVRGWLVQTGHGTLWISDVEFAVGSPNENSPELHVGMALGYTPQNEIFLLKQRIAQLEQSVAKLQAELQERGGKEE